MIKRFITNWGVTGFLNINFNGEKNNRRSGINIGDFKPVFLFFLFISSYISISAQSWIQISIIDSNEVFSITELDNSLFVITTDKIYRGSENGNNWESVHGKPEAESAFRTIYAYKNNLYLGTSTEGVFRSSDNGSSWTQLNNGLPQSALGVVEFAGLGDSLYVGTDNSGIYLLNLLNPSSWQSYNAGLYQYGTNCLYADDNSLHAGLGYYYFVRSPEDSGWDDIFVDSGETQRMMFDFIQHGDYLFAATDNGIYRSPNDSHVWERADISYFPNRDIDALAVDGSRLFAALLFGTDHWIFSTDDFGNSWETRAHEFVSMYDLFVYGNRLWSARIDGLWYYELDVWTDTEKPSTIPYDFEMRGNYPNPFNPTTVISFTVPVTSYVMLTIHDIMGREIKTFESNGVNIGTHTFTWNGRNYNDEQVSSGVYVYRLRAVGKNGQVFEKSAKMMMVK